MATEPPLLRLAPVLRVQFGVVSTRQADARGVSRTTLTSLRRIGLLERLHTGVYRCRLTPDSWEARALAAQFAIGDGASLGRWAAARLLGLTRPAATSIDLVMPRGTKVHRRQPRPRTSLRLTAEDIVEVGPFRCTDVAWTIGELAAVARPPALTRIAGRAVADGLVTLDELMALTDRFADVPGVAVLRQVVGTSKVVVRGTRSRPERRFLALVVRNGLPPPVVNLEVRDAVGDVRYLDAAWPEYAVFVEIDVHPIHGTTLGRRADGWRQNDLVPDWTPLRFDEHDLEHRPDEVVETVRRALIARGWAG